MRSPFVIECLFLSAALAVSQSKSVPSESQVLRSVWDSSVRVDVRLPGGVSEHGSGTVVDVSRDAFVVLTCAHVLADSDRPGAKLSVLHMESNSRHPFRVLASCRKRDVAVLEVKAPGHKARASRVAFSEPYKAGSKLIRCGFPGSRVRQTVHCSVLSEKSYLGSEPEAKLVSATPAAAQGNSGGGLFRVSDGKLVGVTVVSDAHTMGASALPSVHHILEKAGLKHLLKED